MPESSTEAANAVNIFSSLEFEQTNLTKPSSSHAHGMAHGSAHKFCSTQSSMVPAAPHNFSTKLSMGSIDATTDSIQPMTSTYPPNPNASSTAAHGFSNYCGAEGWLSFRNTEICDDLRLNIAYGSSSISGLNGHRRGFASFDGRNAFSVFSSHDDMFDSFQQSSASSSSRDSFHEHRGDKKIIAQSTINFFYRGSLPNFFLVSKNLRLFPPCGIYSVRRPPQANLHLVRNDAFLPDYTLLQGATCTSCARSKVRVLI